MRHLGDRMWPGNRTGAAGAVRVCGPFRCPFSDAVLTVFLCLTYSVLGKATLWKDKRWKPRKRDSP